MAIVESDIVYRLTVTTGPGDSTAQADPDASLGEFVSTTALNLGTPLNNLFDDITGDENAASDVEYRAIAVVNKHATLDLQGAVVWIESQVAGGASVAIGLDPAGVVALDSASAQGAEIGAEGSAPAGVTFSTPTTKGGGLSIGDIGPDEAQIIWIRRTAADSAALDDDGATIRVEGDTAE